MTTVNRAVNLLKLGDKLSKNKESYDCSLCTKRGYNKDKNCDGKYPPKIKDRGNTEVRFIVDKNTVINYCPVIDMLDEDIIFLLDLFVLFKSGFLFTEVEEQPYWYIKAMLELKAANNEIEREYLKRSST